VQQLRGVPSVLTTAASQQAYPCIVVAPQCPEHENWNEFRRRHAESGSADGDPLLKILDSVLKDPRTDPRRIYLMGYSMGAFEVWQMAADVPDMFAAVVPISGGADVNLAQHLIDIRIGAVHGDADGTCSVDATRHLIAAIQAAGGTPRYWELTGVGHHAWAPALQEPSEIIDWLFRQARQPTSHRIPE
jgi:predicted peptidase